MLKRILRIGMWTGTAVIVVLVAVVAAVAIRLSHGPIDATFLQERLEAALAPSDGSFRVESGSTRIAWEGWSDGLAVRIGDLHVVRADGSDLARLPQLSVRLDARALLRGRFAVRAVTAREPHVYISRTEEGRFKVDLAEVPKAQEGSSATLAARLLDALSGDRTTTGGPLDGLDSVRIVNGTVTVWDRATGRHWVTRRFTVDMRRDDEGVLADMSFDLWVDDRPVSFEATARHMRRTGAFRVWLNFRELDPSLFAARSGPLQPLGWFDMPISGTVVVNAFDDGRLSDSEFEITAAKGVVRVPLNYDRGLSVDGLTAKGNLSRDGRTLTIERFAVDLGATSLSMRGVFDGLDGRMSYDGLIAFTRFPVEKLDLYWPHSLKIVAKDWVTQNISAGTIDTLTVQVSLRQSAGPDETVVLEALRGDFEYTDLTVRFYEPLVPVEKVSGTGVFTYKDLRFQVDTGVIRGVRVRRATVDITGFDRPQQSIAITARINGPIADVLTVIDREPLGFASRLGILPTAVEGNADGTIVTRFPLTKELSARDVAITAKGRLTEMHWRKGLFGLDVEQGDFDLDLTERSMQLSGKSLLAGVPAQIAWLEEFGDIDKGKPRRRFDIDTVMAAKTLTGMGLDVDGFLDGTFGAKLRIAGHDDGRTVIDGDYDFGRAGFTIPVFGITKKPGTPAKGRSQVVLRGQRISAVPRFDLESPVVHATGSAAFHGDGVTLRRLVLERFRAGRTDFSGRIDGKEDGTKTVRVTGRALDLEPVLREIGSDSEDGTGRVMPPTTVSADLERLYVGSDNHVSRVSGEVFFDGKRWRRIAIDGRVAAAGGGDAPLSLRLEEAGDARRLRISGDDAGAAFRALGLFDSVRGGRLDITAVAREGQADGAFVGRATIEDFRVVRAPTLARLLALASLRGMANFAADDRGVDFSEFVAPFRLRDGTVTIVDGRSVGSQIGFTFSGTLDLLRDRADIEGTIVPVYVVNSLLGRIPLLGRVIVGEPGSGVFAARYWVSGDLSDPSVRVSMLSALTPGFLRYLGDIFRGEAGERRSDDDASVPRIEPDADAGNGRDTGPEGPERGPDGRVAPDNFIDRGP